MAARVEFLIASTFDGKGFVAATKSAETLDKSQQKVTKSGAALADTVGRVSTTMARSVGVFGLSSTSLRALDDAADIAELGLKGVQGGFNQAATAAVVFQAATLGIIAAVAAIAVALGTFLRWLGDTNFGMKTLGLSTKELDADFRRLFGVIEAGPNKDFTAEMAAKRQSGIEQQIESLRQAGASIDDIAKQSGAALKAMLDPLSESGKIEMLKQFGFSTAEVTKLIPALTDNLKGETEAQKAAAAATNQHAEELKRLAEAALKAFEDQALSASMEAEKKLLEEVEEQARKAAEAFKDLEKAALDAAMASEQWELDQELAESALQAEMLAEELKEAEKATFDWAQQLQNVANLAQTLPGLFGQALSAILGGVSAIGASLKNIGGMSGLKGALSGKSSFGGFLAGLSTVGTIVGAGIGIVKSVWGKLFGDSKKDAEELKKKQDEAVKGWIGLFDQWQQARAELAAKGTAGVNSLIGSMVGEDGKITTEFTSAANAAAYVDAQFRVLVASGMSAAEALAALKPALDAMAKDAKKFGGTVAAPLIQLANFASKNEKLLQFQSGLADTAVSLAAFNSFTQELATSMSVDLGASIDSMVAKGLSYQQALALSADNLFKLQQAAQQSGTTLDAHTQKMIDDAKSAGLFEGLQDPMAKLIELNGAMVAAMGQLIQLFGGAVPAAIQRMIDEFNNAQVSVNVNVSVPSGGPNQTGPNSGPNQLPNKQGPQQGFAEGGYLPERPGGHQIRVGEQGTGGEYMIPANRLSELMGGSAPISIYITAQPNHDERQIAEETVRRLRQNRRGTLSQNTLGYR